LIEYGDRKILLLAFTFYYEENDHFVYLYTKLTCFSPIVLILYLYLTERKNIGGWVRANFERKYLINELYKHTITDIFMGIKPNESNVLQRGVTAEMFKSLSELVDKTINPIVL
jgi:hypothetical protein